MLCPYRAMTFHNIIRGRLAQHQTKNFSFPGELRIIKTEENIRALPFPCYEFVVFSLFVYPLPFSRRKV